MSLLSQPRARTYPFHQSIRTVSSVRNEATVPRSDLGAQEPPISPTTPPLPPPVGQGRFSTLRRIFRWIPWKTLIVIGGIVYIIAALEETAKDGVHAIIELFSVPDNTWLYLNLNDLHVIESPHSERALQIVPFLSSAGKRRMTVLEMTSTLSAAAADPRVKGLVLAFNESIIEHRAILTGEVIESHLGMGVLKELQTAIGKFRLQKRAQRMLQKGENEVVEPPQVQSPGQAVDKFVTIGEDLPVYHPCQDVVIAVADKYCTCAL